MKRIIRVCLVAITGLLTLGFASCSFFSNKNDTTNPVDRVASKGLSYKLVDNSYYEVTGIGVCEDTHIVIPSTYKKLPVRSIAKEAFRENMSLTGITLADSIVKIGDDSFYNCENLNNIEFVEKSADSDIQPMNSRLAENRKTLLGHFLKSDEEKDNEKDKNKDDEYEIGKNAFHGTGFYKDEGNWKAGVLYVGEFLVDVKQDISGTCKIKKGTIHIGSGAFGGRDKLEGVEIPDSVISIGKSAFQACSNLEFVKIGDCVTSIHDKAFAECTKLSSITIPDSVTELGPYIFSDCSGLKEVQLGNSLTILDATFIGCAGLEAITIPDSVTTLIGTFSGCTSLTSISIPDTVTKLDSGVFVNTAYYNNENNWENELLYYGKHLIGSKETISGICTIKDGTISIGEAFYNRDNLISVIMPDSVKYVENFIFDDCDNLESVVFGASIEEIPDFTCRNCPNLNSVTIPNSVKTINDYAFGYCSGLTTITIPNSVENLGRFTFENCTKLESVTIGNAVKTISSDAFNGCTSLTSIQIPTSVTSISGFNNCTGLTSVEIPTSVTSISGFNGCTGLTSVEIPTSVTSISGFNGCTSLASITIPDSVTYISGSAFRNTAYYNDENNWEEGILYLGKHLIKAKQTITGECEIKSGIINISESAFFDCSQMTNVIIPDTVTSIGASAFMNCLSLNSIEIPDSVTNIGDGAFSCCESLKNIKLSSSITVIGMNWFADCRGLTRVEIPDTITKISDGAFLNCENLTELIIPDSVTHIGCYAFASCMNLANIHIPDSVTYIGHGAFNYTAYYNDENNWEDGMFYVGTYLMEARQTETGVYRIKEGTTVITEYAFNSCYNIEEIIIPESVEKIETLAFTNSNLKQVFFENTEGWHAVNVVLDISISEEALETPKKAAKNLMVYCNLDWVREK